MKFMWKPANPGFAVSGNWSRLTIGRLTLIWVHKPEGRKG